MDGPAFINVLAPCRLSWAIPPEDTIDVVRHAVDCCFRPLYEVEEGRWRLTYRPRERKSYVDWLRRRGRFRHRFQPGREELLKN